MIKTFHEAPIQWFNYVQCITDGDYALVHLFEEYPEYFDRFVQAREKGRHVILDNSIFELGVAFDRDMYKSWIYLLKPTEYIIPDVLENAEATVASAKAWNRNEVPGSPIGVLQGTTYDELVWCYREIEPFVDRIAISFDYSYYESLYPKVDNKLQSWSWGRIDFIKQLHDEEIIQKPIHLLGLATPMSMNLYRRYKWVDSIDTSNPVMWAIEKGRYPINMHLINDKPKQKLFTLIDMDTTPSFVDETTTNIIDNITQFRHLLNND